MHKFVLVLALVALVSCKADKPASNVEQKRTATIPVAKIVRDAKAYIPTQQLLARDEQIEISPGYWGVKEGDNKYRMSTVETESDDPVIEGATSVRQMMHKHPNEAKLIQEIVMASNHEREACAKAWQKRGGKLDQMYSWVIALHFIGDGKIVKVIEVRTLRDHWPKTFDDEAKDCYLNSFAHMQFASASVFNIVAEYPLCVNKQEG